MTFPEALPFACGTSDPRGCTNRLPRRGLCDVHRQELAEAHDRARMGKKRRPKAKPTPAERVLLDRQRAERDELHRAQHREKREAARAYRERVAQVAADRLEAETVQLVEFVRVAGRPVSRTEAATALGLIPGRVGDAARHARESGRLAVEGRKYVVPTTSQEDTR